MISFLLFLAAVVAIPTSSGCTLRHPVVVVSDTLGWPSLTDPDPPATFAATLYLEGDDLNAVTVVLRQPPVPMASTPPMVCYVPDDLPVNVTAIEEALRVALQRERFRLAQLLASCVHSTDGIEMCAGKHIADYREHSIDDTEDGRTFYGRTKNETLAFTVALIDNDVKVFLSYTNGSPCGDRNRTATVSLRCLHTRRDPGAGAVDWEWAVNKDRGDACHTTVDVWTTKMCPLRDVMKRLCTRPVACRTV